MSNIALKYRLYYRRKRNNFTGKELDAETGLYYYGARYLDPKTSRWLSGDPALGEYFPVAPVNDEAKKRNQNLPGQGGVFNYVNLHAYHYAGNNPVVLTDPDGKTEIDFENKIISADIADIKDLDKANRQLSVLQNEGFKVIASDKSGNQKSFDSFLGLSNYLNEIDPRPNLVPENSTLMIGIGIGLFCVGGVGVEIGLAYSHEQGADIYLTGGFGFGVGVSTKLTGNINTTPSTNLHGQFQITATAGAGPAANFDLLNSGKFTGISGLAAGGGILFTGTGTFRGYLNDAKSAISKITSLFRR